MILQLILPSFVIVGVIMMPDYDAFESNVITLSPELYNRINEPHNVRVQRKFKEAFSQKCDSYNITPRYLEKTVNTFGECSTQLLGLEENVLMNKKYCEQILPCYNNTANLMQQCLDEQEKGTTNVLYKIFDSVQEFMCNKNGEQIKPLFTGDGSACLKSKRYKIYNCFENSIDANDILYFYYFDWPILKSLRNGDCTKLDSLKQCVVSILNECNTNTTSLIAASLFESIRNKTCARNLSDGASFGRTNQALFSLDNASVCVTESVTTLATLVAVLLYLYH